MFLCRMERYFPLRRTDLVNSIPAGVHFTRQNAEGSWKSGCFKRRKVLHRNKFNKYRYSKFFLNIYLTQMEQEISGISKFQRKGQPREVDQNFRNDFPELSVPFDFQPAGISGNFGRMERAPYLPAPPAIFFQKIKTSCVHMTKIGTVQNSG